MLEEVLDEKSDELRVWVLVDLRRGGRLPLEAGRLLGVAVGVVLDRLEHTRAQLGAEVAEGTFLFQILNHDVLEVVHLFK